MKQRILKALAPLASLAAQALYAGASGPEHDLVPEEILARACEVVSQALAVDGSHVLSRDGRSSSAGLRAFERMALVEFAEVLVRCRGSIDAGCCPAHAVVPSCVSWRDIRDASCTCLSALGFTPEAWDRAAGV